MRRSYLLGAGLAIMVAGMANTAMAQSEIKIGEINSYSALPAFTEAYRKGWQLAVEEVNAAGGINGKKIKLDIEDEACDPKQAVAVANRLASLHVKFVDGHACSGASIPASEVYAENKMLMITPSSSN